MSGRTSGVCSSPPGNPEQAGAANPHAGAFTRFVAGLTEGSEPSDAAFEELWDALEAAVSHELRRRGLWTLPPTYAGVEGSRSWLERGPEPGALRPLDELLTDCYAFVFVDRLPRLRAHLRTKDNLEGLVFRSIRNFLHERQRRHDPLGIRVFEVLRRGLGVLVEEGELVVLSGDRRLRGSTRLARPGVSADESPGSGPGARPAAEPAEGSSAGDDSSSTGELLAQAAPPWADRLLPHLMSPAARATEVAEILRAGLDEVAGRGLGSFSVSQLAAPLKAAVRRRWTTWRDRSLGPTGLEATDAGERIPVPIRRADFPERLEAADHLARLLDGVDRRLTELDTDERTRDELRRLWGFLRLFSQGGREGSDAPNEDPASPQDFGDRLPSNRRLARYVQIPRERIPARLATLRDLARHERERLRGHAARPAWSRGASRHEGDPGPSHDADEGRASR